MMQEASGEGPNRQVTAPPASPDRTTSLLDRNFILYLPSENDPKRPFSLEPHLKGYYCPFPSVLFAYLKHDGHDASNPTTAARYRARLLRHLQKLRELGVIDLDKLEYSILQIRLTGNGLNLIRREQNSNRPENLAIGPYPLPRRARKERVDCLLSTTKNQMIPEDRRTRIAEKFQDYLDDVEDRRVILCEHSDKQNPDTPLYFLPYKTRFTAYDRKKTNLDTYEAIWKYSGTRFQTAVFLTLTTDPRMHTSAYHANKHFQIALNRLMSRLAKRGEGRPKYLNVHEFQKNGLLHSHIVIFGLDYLTDFRRLSEMWKKCGQGRIVYIYGLRNNGQAWTWSRARPKDAKKGRTVDAYLKKYLKKALFDNSELELYWTFNKRFFTYSRSLKPASPPRDWTGPRFHFIGSAPSDMIQILLERRSRQLWGQIRAAEYAASTGPPF